MVTNEKGRRSPSETDRTVHTQRNAETRRTGRTSRTRTVWRTEAPPRGEAQGQVRAWQRRLESPTTRRECQCSWCTQSPAQHSGTAQDQQHAQGLVLCHTGHRETLVGPGKIPTVHQCVHRGRLWVAQTYNSRCRRPTEFVTQLLTW